MALAEALAAAKAEPSIIKCSVCKALRAMDDGDREVLEAALADADYQSEQIGRALRAEGFQVQGQAIARHRNGKCVSGSR